jgi:hypothetical protein
MEDIRMSEVVDNFINEEETNKDTYCLIIIIYGGNLKWKKI